MTMPRISSRPQSRQFLPLAALALGALMLTAAPVSLDRSGLGLQQAYAQGDGDHGSDRGGAEGGGSDRGADSGSADRGSVDRGSTGAAGTNVGSTDIASHDANDR
jgi:hypothetical protein